MAQGLAYFLSDPTTTSTIMNKTKSKLIPMWFIHHTSILEPLCYPLDERIQCIKHNKPAREKKSRLEAMKPVLKPWLLPKPVLRALRKAHNKGRLYSPQMMMEYLRKHPDMMAKVRRRLFLEYPKCPVTHKKEDRSELVYTEAARLRARMTNRRIIGKQ